MCIRDRDGWDADGLVEEVDELHGQREDDGGVLFDADLGEGLQVAELEGHGLGGHEGCGVDQFGGGVELALGVDDLGAALALGLGLLGPVSYTHLPAPAKTHRRPNCPGIRPTRIRHRRRRRNRRLTRRRIAQAARIRHLHRHRIRCLLYTSRCV